MQTVDSLIQTKLSLPYVRPHLVARPQLLDWIRLGLSGPITLVIAPAGFGKTTLVASAVQDIGTRSVWLSLDKDDNQIERFLRYLIAAFQRFDPVIGMKAGLALSSAQQVKTEPILTSLINDLDNVQQDMILVLDDYHLINDPSVHAAVTFLLEHCPNLLHLAIAARSDPPLPLTRLRARGQLVELRTSDLRFTIHEASQFLNEVMGLHLDDHLVAVLEERTEGWVAGLQMAALSMRDRKDIAGFIEGFSGTNRYILDYLLEEVLASQPPEIQHFLLYTSLLERITPSLCDTILAQRCEQTGKPDETRIPGQSAITLAYLERANLFLVPLDDQQIWYRYHNLFADLLRNQLQKILGDGGINQLHLCAAEWYEQNSLPIDAIHHASLASDFERIERIIEHNYLEMMNRGEMALIRFWLGKLNQEIVSRRPWLCLYEAFSRSWFGQLEEAQFFLDLANRYISSNTVFPDRQAMIGYHAYVQSRVMAMQGTTRAAIDSCLAAHKNIPADNLGLQIEVGITLGYEYFLIGDFINAGQTLNEMIQVGYAVQAINNPIAAYALLARAQKIQGRLRDGYDLFQKADQWVRMAGGRHLGAVGLIEVGIAEFVYEWNDLEAARGHLRQGLEYLPWWGKADDEVLAYVTLARIQLASGNQIEAAGAIEKAVQLEQNCGLFTEAHQALQAVQISFWLDRGNWHSIDHWMASQDKIQDVYRFEDEQILITRARVWVRQQQYERALALLKRLEENARQAGRRGRLVEILLLKALSLQPLRQSEQAAGALSESLALAEPEGYLRTFLDEGHPLQMLLGQWLAIAGDSPLREYAARLWSLFETEARAAQTEKSRKAISGDDLAEPLTPRELEVLHLMALGSTNQEIAARLVVSPGTIKAHAASIYRKLDAANRTEAVARARQLGILT